jgi:hypothetical protein
MASVLLRAVLLCLHADVATWHRNAVCPTKGVMYELTWTQTGSSAANAAVLCLGSLLAEKGLRSTMHITVA